MLLLALMSCGSVAGHYNVAADPADPKETVVEIPKGSLARGLGPVLEQAGVIDDGGDFGLYVRLSGEGGCIKAGKFRLNRTMTPEDILRTLCGAPIPDDIPFTVVEGWRIREIDAALVSKGLASPGQYTALALDPSQFTATWPLPTTSLEGYLYPDTYMVTPDRFDLKKFIQRQLDLFGERFAIPHKDDLGDRTLGEIVILASMLAREEPHPQNRPLVAGILYNRIRAGWNLGVDATSRYTLEDWNDRAAFMKNLRDPNEPYNTRLRPGLPPTAIGNPALPSLEAARAPVESEYWYYLHDSTATLHPSRNAAEHEAFRRRYNVY